MNYFYTKKTTIKHTINGRKNNQVDFNYYCIVVLAAILHCQYAYRYLLAGWDKKNYFDDKMRQTDAIIIRFIFFSLSTKTKEM